MATNRLDGHDSKETTVDNPDKQELEEGYNSSSSSGGDADGDEYPSNDIRGHDDIAYARHAVISGQSKVKQAAEAVEDSAQEDGPSTLVQSAAHSTRVPDNSVALPEPPPSPRPKQLSLPGPATEPGPSLWTPDLQLRHHPQNNSTRSYARGRKPQQLPLSQPMLQPPTLRVLRTPTKKRSPLGLDKVLGPSPRQPPPRRLAYPSPSISVPVVYKSVTGPRYRRTSDILKAELGYEPMFIPVRVAKHDATSIPVRNKVLARCRGNDLLPHESQALSSMNSEAKMYPPIPSKDQASAAMSWLKPLYTDQC